MTLDVIICTYQREESINTLVNQLKACSPPPHRIIVVDASDEENTTLKQDPDIQYLRSNHKNQPYQRLCGWSVSTADILMYLDDDMEVVKLNVVDLVKSHFTMNPEHVALAINFKDKHATTSLSDIPVSTLLKKGSRTKQIWNLLSGQPEQGPGQLGWCGLRGKQPMEGGYTEWLSGGAFAARRNKLFQHFNFQLFDLFEQKKGMGEDALIGYTLSKLGKVYFLPEVLFYHVDVKGSHYAANPRAYSERVMYSRMFLSLEKARLDGLSFIMARLHFLWYGLCRMIGYLLNALLHPGKKRTAIFIGSLKGYLKGLFMKRVPLQVSEKKWFAEMKMIKE